MTGVVGALLVAGCTSTSAGSPVPATTEQTGPATSIESPTTTPTSTWSFPPPPREIPLDDVDPCDLLTPDQALSFGLEEQPASEASSSPSGGLICNWLSPGGQRPQLAHTISTAPRLDLAAGVEGRVFADGGVTAQVEVDGFPAVRLERDGDFDGCMILIGTASGQHLTVMPTCTPNELPIDEFCEIALTMAEMVMDNLQGQ